MNVSYALVSVVIVSLVSVLFALPLFFKKKISDKVLVFLLSISVGVLLATVFINFLPEVFGHSNHAENQGLLGMLPVFYILGGFLVMFILEKLIHFHHNKKCSETPCHGHAYTLAPVNLVGDGIHNLIDGLVIAGSYAVNVGVGIAATISIIFHEIPQEIADFGVLLYSGMSKKKALVFNFFSACTAVLGTLAGLFLIGQMEGFHDFIIPFAAGNFVYIAASNLVPQLHRHCKLLDTVIHIGAIVLGIVIIVLISMFGPAHAH